MSIRKRVAEDLKEAMKARDTIRLETLRMIRAELMAREIERRGEGKEMSDDDEVAVLMSSAKKRRESIDLFNRGGRNDLVEKEEKELGILKDYLPALMEPHEVEESVDRILADFGEVSPTAFGKAMSLVMKELKGKADGRVVQEVVRRKTGLDQKSG